jgi:hypothetical protein
MIAFSKLVQSLLKVDQSDALTLEKHVEIVSIGNLELDRIGFSRSRLIAVKWEALIRAKSDTTKNTVFVVGDGYEQIRLHVETLLELKQPLDLFDINSRLRAGIDYPVCYFETKTKQPIDVLSKFEISPGESRFTSLAEYEDMWNKSFQVVIGLTNERLSELTEVSLAPKLIYTQYRELDAIRQLGKKLSENADKIASAEASDFLTSEELETKTRGYLRMKAVLFDADQKLLRLKAAASDLGYFLAVKEGGETYTYPNGDSKKLEAGQLYLPHLSRLIWTRYESRTQIKFRQPFNIPYVAREEIVNTQIHTVTVFNEFVPDLDPWVEAERALNKSGYSVYRFERIGSRYVAKTGETIQEIMGRCEFDPAFRNKCAVMIPVYEQTLVQAEVLSRYIVVKHPRKGITPVHLPRLYFEEDLQMSTHYQGVRVGELVHSINLAPGEKREITVERSTSSSSETRRSTTSILDLNESDKVDLSTELEKEASNSTEKTSMRSLSAKVGGSYGGFSGSAEGSTSENVSTKQFARDLQKIANRASKSVTRQTRNEVRTESSTKLDSSRRDSSKISISNINEGRTLNLLFYQLYNIYRLRLRIERLQFVYISGCEIVAGSGLVLPEIYPLYQLKELLSVVSTAHLPVVLASGFDSDKARKEVEQQILKAIVLALQEDYFVEADDKEKPITPPPPPAVVPDPSKVDLEVNDVLDVLNKMLYNPNSDLMHGSPELVVGSPGMYLDANVGAKAATEEYSEKMRDAEFAARIASVRETEARALQLEALAHRTYSVDPGFSVTAKAISLKELELTFTSKPIAGLWKLYEGSTVLTDITSTDQLIQNFQFSSDQAWLKSDRLNVVRMIHAETLLMLVFVV